MIIIILEEHSYLKAASSFRNSMEISHGWEVLVEIEGKRVEFFTSRVSLERTELIPPMLTTILPHRAFFLVEGVV